MVIEPRRPTGPIPSDAPQEDFDPWGMREGLWHLKGTSPQSAGWDRDAQDQGTMGIWSLNIFLHFILTSSPFHNRADLKDGAGIPPYLVALAELEVQAAGQRAPCTPQSLSLVATIQVWSRFPLHAPTTWEDRSVTGEQ